MGESEASELENDPENLLAGKKRAREDSIDRLSIHESELDSDNLNDSEEDENPHGFLVGDNLNTF